jgi:hypothetical protein
MVNDVSVWRANALEMRWECAGITWREFGELLPHRALGKTSGELIWEVAQPVFCWAAARGVAPRGEEFQLGSVKL